MCCDWKDPVLEPWVGSNWYPDPANPGMARYYNGVTRAWIGKPKKGQRTWPIPTDPPERWVAATDPTKGAIAYVGNCRVLGGHGLGLATGAVVEVVFWRSALTIRTPASVQLGKTSPQHAEIPYDDVVALEIGGPGAKRTGGGFVGGGFGLEGAAEGMLIASALNLLTHEDDGHDRHLSPDAIGRAVPPAQHRDAGCASYATLAGLQHLCVSVSLQTATPSQRATSTS